jgi:hypothetical protein
MNTVSAIDLEPAANSAPSPQPTKPATARRIPSAAEAPFDYQPLLALRKWVKGTGWVLPEPLDPAWAAHLTYTDRETYLAWVSEWKAIYAALTVAQRARKAARREGQRTGVALAAPQDTTNPTWWWGPAEGKTHARALLALRAAGKVDSWAKRNAIKATQSQEA